MSSGLCDLFEDKRKFCVFETRGYGFGSEINNLLYFLYYCKNNNVKFCFLNSNISSNSRRRRTSLRWEYYFPYMEKHINSCSELTTAFDFRSARNSRDVVKIGLNFFFTSVHKFSAIFKNAAPAHPIFLTERVKKYRDEDFFKARRFCFIERAKNPKEFYCEMGDILNAFWNFNLEVYREMEPRLTDFKNRVCGEPYVTIHVRRGDKLKSEDRMYNSEKYTSFLLK